VAKFSRLLLVTTNFVTAVSGLLCVTIAIYFFFGFAGSVDGGIDRWLAAIIVLLTFVISIGAMSSVSYRFYRDPNYQPTFGFDPKLFFWVVVPVAFFALAEILYLASGALIGALTGILASAGLTVPEAVNGILLWLLMGAGMIAAAMFLWQTWKRFKALPD
jgi:hypothetical protein